MVDTAAEAHPLHWPVGRPRTPHWKREQARFDTSFASARDAVVAEVRRLTGRRDPRIVISTNLALRRDGLPLAGQKRVDDPGVAVYFEHAGRSMAFACDRWRAIEDNMQAIVKTIDALRGIARWGTGDMQAAAFTGFTALPPPGASAGAPAGWRSVLGLAPGERRADEIRAAYRRLASEHHPDRGGDAARMSSINAAMRDARAEIPEL